MALAGRLLGPWMRAERLRWVGVALSLVALVLLVALVRQADWADLTATLAAARPEWLLAALLLALAVELCKGLRWQVLLGVDLGRLPELFGVLLSSRLLNALAPLRAGDVWRVAFAARVEQRHLVTAGGSVLAEKLLDAAALGILGLLLVGSAGPDLRRSAAVGLALLAGAGLWLAVIAARRPRRLAWLSRFTAELSHLRDRSVLFRASALTAAGLGLGLLVNLLVLRALDLPISLTLGLSMLLSGYAAGLLPGVPGRLGVFELAVSSPLLALGLSPAAALAAAVGLHLVVLATLALGGLCAVPLSLLAQGRRRPLVER